MAAAELFLPPNTVAPTSAKQWTPDAKLRGGHFYHTTSQITLHRYRSANLAPSSIATSTEPQ